MLKYIFICGISILMTTAKAENTFTKTLTKATVAITNLTKSSGGSGVILLSKPTASYVLTNKHVCALLEKGEGLVTNSTNESYKIVKYKASMEHDICIVNISADLEVNMRLAKVNIEPTNNIYISGHPQLLPTVVSMGLSSSQLQISVIEGFDPCTEKQEEDPMLCIFMGGTPRIVVREALLTTALISPGSSGSGVFNSKGEIVGLAFAGSGDLSYSFVVPVSYIHNFIKQIKHTPWQYPGEKMKNEISNTSAVGLTATISVKDSSFQNKTKRLKNE